MEIIAKLSWEETLENIVMLRASSTLICLFPRFRRGINLDVPLSVSLVVFSGFGTEFPVQLEDCDRAGFTDVQGERAVRLFEYALGTSILKSPEEQVCR